MFTASLSGVRELLQESHCITLQSTVQIKDTFGEVSTREPKLQKTKQK